jgi:hypothetical protein
MAKKEIDFDDILNVFKDFLKGSKKIEIHFSETHPNLAYSEFDYKGKRYVLMEVHPKFEGIKVEK